MLLTSTACLPKSAAARTIDLTSPGNTVNGKTADIAITTHGSDFFFAICAAMCVAGLTFIGLAYRKERRDRLFHYMTAAVVFVAAIAYCKQCQQPSDWPVVHALTLFQSRWAAIWALHQSRSNTPEVTP
jgi:hypothetical protein